MWVGLAWARYFALSLPAAAAAVAAGEASVARAGFFPRLCGLLGVTAWQAEAVARPAGAAVATPRAPSSFSSAAVAAAGEAPVARAGSVPRVCGVLGVAAWPAEAVSRPAGVAAAAPRAPSSLSFAAVAAADEAPETVERDPLYAYQGLKDTTKDVEPVEDHLPACIHQGASNPHSEEDKEDKIKLLDLEYRS